MSESINGSNVVSTLQVMDVALSKHYGRKTMLSLCSKFFWGHVRSPIIIYDANARSELKAPTDYAGYVECWRRRYDDMRLDIERVCCTLPGMRAYSSDYDYATEEVISDLSREQRFKERVLDIWLWNMGAPA